MCGIAGFWNSSADWSAEVSRQTISAMTSALRHRGPDDAGIWFDNQAGLAFGHTRLAILDPTPLGHQPMTSASGRYVVTFNGEIYNFLDLRAELASEGYPFRTRCDTEVLLAAIESWGLDRAVKRLDGMFAFAVWDCHLKVLQLVRDRFGEKPLYYGWAGNTLLFASELKALDAVEGFDPDIDRSALASFLSYKYVPSPLSIYSAVKKLPPGTTARVESANLRLCLTLSSYWSAAAETIRCRQNNAMTRNRLADLFEERLLASVRSRMTSDVPVGALLSGGIDSSTVVALMQRLSPLPVRTFTLGFEDLRYDEARYARVVAEYLGTAHSEVILTQNEASAIVPEIPGLYDEPFADSSQVATVFLARFVRNSVSVVLSGDGGDELFGGYERYAVAARLWRVIRPVPGPLRKLAASAFLCGRHRVLQLLATAAQPFAQHRLTLDKLERLAPLLNSGDRMTLFRRLKTDWVQTIDESQSQVHESEIRFNESAASGLTFHEQMMCADTVGYLPDDILVKLDRACMSTGLECRVPLLDPSLAEFAWSLPRYVRDEGGGKRLLRECLYRYVPPALVDRPKAGFALPLARWLRGSLREWAEDLLDEGRLKQEGYLDPSPIRRCWTQHLSREYNWSGRLWNVLMFQGWLALHRARVSFRHEALRYRSLSSIEVL